MATMNVGSGETSSQDDIAREVASAIADDNSGEQQSIQDVSQNINFVSSESGSFVRISTSSEDMAGPTVRPAVSSTGAVALNFGDEGSTLQIVREGRRLVVMEVYGDGSVVLLVVTSLKPLKDWEEILYRKQRIPWTV